MYINNNNKFRCVQVCVLGEITRVLLSWNARTSDYIRRVGKKISKNKDYSKKWRKDNAILAPVDEHCAPELNVVGKLCIWTMRFPKLEMVVAWWESQVNVFRLSVHAKRTRRGFYFLSMYLRLIDIETKWLVQTNSFNMFNLSLIDTYNF